jgi:hypothetical protein
MRIGDPAFAWATEPQLIESSTRFWATTLQTFNDLGGLSRSEPGGTQPPVAYYFDQTKGFGSVQSWLQGLCRTWGKIIHC